MIAMAPDALARYRTDHVTRVGAGTPLLLLHGIGHSRVAWDPVLPHLASRHEVIVVDLPGHGGAPTLDVEPSEDALAVFLAALMDDLAVERPHVAGNSLGGHVGLLMGMNGDVASVTAISPGGMVRGWERPWTRGLLSAVGWIAPKLADVPGVASTALGRQVALKVMFARPERQSYGYARESLAGLGNAPGWDATRAAMTLHRRVVRPIDVPVTIAWGSRDYLLLPWQAKRWLDQLEDARHVPLKGLGHVPMPDDPELVAATITDTTARAERAAAATI